MDVHLDTLTLDVPCPSCGAKAPHALLDLHQYRRGVCEMCETEFVVKGKLLEHFHTAVDELLDQLAALPKGGSITYTR